MIDPPFPDISSDKINDQSTTEPLNEEQEKTQKIEETMKTNTEPQPSVIVKERN